MPWSAPNPRILSAAALLLAVFSASALAQAPALVSIGQNDLHLGRLSEAQTNCDAALKLDPNSQPAKDCLDQTLHALIDQDLDQADAKLLAGDKPGAISLASKWTAGVAHREQQVRAREILAKAHSIGVAGILKLLFPDWLLNVLLTVATITVLALVLMIARLLWREWKRGKWYGNLTNTTKWIMRPLKDMPATGDQAGIAADMVLDALARAGHELQQPLWEPHLLLLRPTPPANYEPAVLSEFLSDNMDPIRTTPPANDLCLEWKLHDVRLDEAVQNLQLKTTMGIDMGSVVRFLMSLVRWFNAGEPTISGVATTVAEKSISIHLAAHGGRVESVAVTATSDFAPGIDATKLSAERVAFKFLFRMRYPEMMDDQIDGLSALRQGATLFAQFAGTAPGIGENAKARTASLERAAFSFGFFRASIPAHCNPGCGNAERSSLQITDDLRQAVLLAEGVAHSLAGSDEGRMCAIACFRQLQDWPGSERTELLRRQAAYNEAVVWAHSGSVARSVLMLTELLGEKAPDTVATKSEVSTVRVPEKKATLPEAISFPARVARVTAFARYDRDSWAMVPECRVELIANDAERLIKDLDVACNSKISARNHRLVQYMYVEALRSAGHIELMRVIQSSKSRLYESGRPTGLRHASLSEDETARLSTGISYLRACEELSQSSELYCDMAESYLLLKQFILAEGYARHAILESSPPSERAYYVAVESLWLQNTPRAEATARKYLSEFKREVTLEEFKTLQAEMAAGGSSREALSGL